MWWGGFSESGFHMDIVNLKAVLIPMWWGGFSEKLQKSKNLKSLSLNPHVVGRFFRGVDIISPMLKSKVLIPMWWGGFSETR